MIKRLLLVLLMGCAFNAQAEVTGHTETGGNEPEITIRHADNGNTIYEYSVNGEVREIKIVPKVGKPYYLVPKDGTQDFIRTDKPTAMIPKWIIFKW